MRGYVRSPRHPCGNGDFIARLAALVPPPRMHLIRFHGVFAPHAALRAAITPAGRGWGRVADLPKAQYDKLFRLLKKKYGLVKKGKGHGNVAEAFGKMIDAAAKKA
jgi:hypothetical protein